MPDPKNSLNVALTEPVLFLLSSDPSGRNEIDTDDAPTVLRGILTLNIVKPIEISSIEVELSGLLTICRMEGFGPHRTDVQEKRKVYSSSTTVFSAYKASRRIRPASVGPGLASASLTNDGDDLAIRRHSQHQGTTISRLNLGPSPPYSPVALSPIRARSRLAVPGENPTETLQELERVPRLALDGQVRRDEFAPLSSRPPSIMFTRSDSTTFSSGSSVPTLDQEHDNHSDDIAHTSSPLPEDEFVHTTTEESLHTLHHRSSPSRPIRTYSPGPGDARQTRSRVRRNDHDVPNSTGSRSRLRVSLGSVLGIAFRSPRSRSAAAFEETERGRTRARILDEHLDGEGIRQADDGDNRGDNPLGTNSSHLFGHMEHREHHLLGLGRFLGLERSHETEKDAVQQPKERDDWKEFQPGTYSYPISFLLPPDLPPTFSVPHGSLDYSIKGIAHRPGTFTSKLSCKVPVLVVAAPTDSTGAGDPGPLSVQRQWEAKLAYSIGLSSRLFILGSGHHREGEETEAEGEAQMTHGAVTLDLTLLPLEKVKIWKLSLFVDQQIRYLDERGLSIRENEIRKVKLLELEDSCLTEELDDEEHAHKNKNKNAHSVSIPLLPTPISPHRSPLLRYIAPSVDPSMFMGPGPYTLSIKVGLPGCNDHSEDDDGLHFGVRQKSSGVKVTHFLRLVIRVERLDNRAETRRRMFDITLKVPIVVLSCRCLPAFQTLPSYAQISNDELLDSRPATCPCQPRVASSLLSPDGENLPSSPSSFDEGEDGVLHFHHQVSDGHVLEPHRRPTTPLPIDDRETTATTSGHAHMSTHSHGSLHHNHHHHHARSQSHSSTTSHIVVHSTHVHTPPVLSPHSSRPPSPLARYERLVSGLESELGEAPPSYESIAPSF